MAADEYSGHFRDFTYISGDSLGPPATRRLWAFSGEQASHEVGRIDLLPEAPDAVVGA